MAKGFIGVTENPGDLITREALEMIAARYFLAVKYSKNKDVLELGCGPGVGLGYLASQARSVVGGDFDGNMVRTAQHTYAGRIGVARLDAQVLPFAARSFDVILLYEAIYYLHDPGKFLDECKRVLRESGMLIVCSVNKSWPDFNPSPFSIKYYSAPDLCALLMEHSFETDIFGAFPAATSSVSRKMVSLIKRTAISLHLIPGSMKNKQWLKRIFYGKLTPVPLELSAVTVEGLQNVQGDIGILVPLSKDSSWGEFKVIYAVGRLI